MTEDQASSETLTGGRGSERLISRSGRLLDIREAALTPFAERGYHATSMEDIGRIVGVRGPSLYNHLKSKHEILVDIMVTTMRELNEEFDRATRLGSPSRRVWRAMEAHVRYHAVHPREVRIGNREISSLDRPARDKVVSLRSGYENKWRQLIQEGLDSGEFSIPSPRVAVYAILEMGIGVAQWYRPDGTLTLDQIAELYADMATRLLKDHEIVTGNGAA